MHIMRISFFSLLPALLLSVFMASPARAQMPRDHAVLYMEAEEPDDELVNEIAALGGRIAVRYSSLLLVRFPSGAGESIAETHFGTRLLRSREDCELPGKNLTPHISSARRTGPTRPFCLSGKTRCADMRSSGDRRR